MSSISRLNAFLLSVKIRTNICQRKLILNGSFKCCYICVKVKLLQFFFWFHTCKGTIVLFYYKLVNSERMLTLLYVFMYMYNYIPTSFCKFHHFYTYPPPGLTILERKIVFAVFCFTLSHLHFVKKWFQI